MVFGVWDTADRDDFFFGICLSEDNAIPAETKPAVGFVNGVAAVGV